MISKDYIIFSHQIVFCFPSHCSKRLKREITQKNRKLLNFFAFVVGGLIIFYNFAFKDNKKPQIMPNRKDLKSTINSICSDVFAECVAMSLYHGNAHEDNVEALLKSILAIRNDFISRISHPEPGMKKKVYFDHLANSFAEQISEVIDQISNLSE